MHNRLAASVSQEARMNVLIEVYDFKCVATDTVLQEQPLSLHDVVT